MERRANEVNDWQKGSGGGASGISKQIKQAASSLTAKLSPRQHRTTAITITKWGRSDKRT